MDEQGLTQVRAELEDFAAVVFAGLSRSDQRASGLRYLRGLMLDGQRKSMEPMAARLGIDHQQLQQFVTSSTWDVSGVRARLATMAVEVIAPTVWVVDDTGFPKSGKASPCVARQYSGTLGKVSNCQIAVSVHAATTAASAMLGARLFVPESWDDTCVPGPDGTVVNSHAHRLRAEATTLDAAGVKKPHVRKQVPPQELVAGITRRRAAAKIPDEQRYRPKWVIALELLDELAGWGLHPPVLTADAGYGQVAEFRQGLTDRDIRYIVATTSATTVQPGHAVPVTKPYAGVGIRPKPVYPDPAVRLKDLAATHAREHLTEHGVAAAQPVRWRPRLPDRTRPDKPAGELVGHFFALRVRPAGRTIPRGPDGVLPECWLLVEWPPGANEPSDYWLSDLPADLPLSDLVAQAKARWRIEHDYRELKTGLGLDHFEGRSWTGWHRHVTLTAAAQLFLTRLRLTNPKVPGQT
ncbi:MAG TPA: transposase [Actinoplanes sp.]|nr:transposase [Actinoplanes sp.]